MARSPARRASARKYATKKRKAARAAYNAYTKGKRLEQQTTLAGRPPGEICELCSGPPTGRGRLHFDHCHATGKFRGWICHHCNLALGYARDDVNLLQRMIAYLAKS